MIGIPYAIRLSGIVAGIILLAVVGVFTDHSVNLLIHYGLKAKKIRFVSMVTFC